MRVYTVHGFDFFHVCSRFQYKYGKIQRLQSPPTLHLEFLFSFDAQLWGESPQSQYFNTFSPISRLTIEKITQRSASSTLILMHLRYQGELCYDALLRL